ncbi:T9SS type A sorting domain-containing protein [bacterium]|nr:T9SS type A sorting domain-containing protein [bacterium]
MKAFYLILRPNICLMGMFGLLIVKTAAFAQCTADFYADETRGEAPFTTHFHDNSSSNATSWFWQFPGGTPNQWQGQNPPAITYNNEGSYSVTLSITCNIPQDVRVRTDYIQVFIRYDYGDAPENDVAYPDLAVIGHFPTCYGGSAGFIRHTDSGHTFLGHHADYELDGNGSFCPAFSPNMYDRDEMCHEGESCLWKPDVYTIEDGSVVPLCEDMSGSILGYPCSTARWGENINIWFDTDRPEGAYVNVLIDWNQDGEWGGTCECDQGNAPEHILRNFHVSGASNGHLSVLDPPSFRIGPNSGYVWARFTITEDPIPLPWDGGGRTFHSGETEDHLLKVGSLSELFDYGDAPASYATLDSNNGPKHVIVEGVHLGQGVSPDNNGKPSKSADGDDDDGVQFLNDMVAGDTASIEVIASTAGMLKAWADFNQNENWDGDKEKVLDTEVDEGSNKLKFPIPDLAKEGMTYIRFRFSGGVLKGPDGPIFGGEIEDYFIEIFRFFEYEFGDAPEGIMAYDARWVELEDEDVIGNFATCGDYGRARHGNLGTRYFGDSVDFEDAGNAGCCDCGYDRDELFYDGDAGLNWGHIYTITGDPGAEIITHAGGVGSQMVSCGIGRWGDHLDIYYHCDDEDGAYVNVLVDWNMSGGWNDGGAIYHCDDPGAPHIDEHIVKDLFVPYGSGYLSSLDPPDFRTGGPGGYVWARFTISDTPVSTDDWTGHGDFADGETEDYLLHVARSTYRDYGDAPDGDIAYPGTDIVGDFPTCPASGSNTIRHGTDSGVFNRWFGCSLCPPTTETSGNRGLCRGAYNLDDDNGLAYTPAYTIEDGTVVEQFRPMYTDNNTIGSVCQMAEWGSNNLDISWTNQMGDEWAYVNVLIDWNQDGEWGGSVSCEDGHSTEEHVLKNYPVPPAHWGSGLGAHRFEDPPDFRIGPNAGYVWARFTITPEPVSLPWNGTGDFEDGETEDYLLKVGGAGTIFYLDFGDAWLAMTQNNDGGAAHTVVAGFHLGDLIDPDGDGQPDKGAAGDDNDGKDDDDGVEFLNVLSPGEKADIKVTASAAGILSAWLDFNQNGTWGDDEDQIIEDEELDEGDNSISFLIPATAAPGSTYVRFRFSNEKGLSFSGPHFTGDPMENPNDLPPIGEVEDYVVVVEADSGEYDYGDAPDPRYPTVSTSLGAWHLKDATLWLGQLVDTEGDGLPASDAKGDDDHAMDDEDGVQFHNTWTVGSEAKFTVSLSDSGYLNTWADLNGDGDWEDSGEQIIIDDYFGPGSKLYEIPIPVDAWLDSTYVRFRVSRTSGLSPRGYAPDGEVEDYFIAGISTEIDQAGHVPGTYDLKQNRPNPFNPDTQIQFSLPSSGDVRIIIYNMRGQIVKTLMNQRKPAGHHMIRWDGRNDEGWQMPSGVYVYTLKVGSFFAAKKLLLLK